VRSLLCHRSVTSIPVDDYRIHLRVWLRVAALSVFHPPAHGCCVQCAFLWEYIPDLEEMLAMRKALDADRKDEAA
jgi:hypothetical protein